MNFRECLISAQQQGAISQDEAEELLKRFEQLRGQHSLNMDPATAGARARDDLAAELRAEGIEMRRRAALQKAAVERAERDVLTYRSSWKGRADVAVGALRLLENFGFAGYSSVEGRTKAILSMVQAELNEVLITFQRGIATGARKEMPRLERVRDEMLGKSTGDPTAREFAQKIASVNEALRQRFNAAGGAIGKLDGGYIPQWHDAEAILKAGKQRWKETITPLLDMARMRDPMTGQAFDPARLDNVLDVIYERIVTDGASELVPTSAFQGRGMLASQRAEHRFLHFKGPEEWQAYADAFGNADVFSVLMNHIRGMAADIAAMEVLGPNPTATLNFLKQLVERERGKAILGQESAFNAKGPLAALNSTSFNYQLDGLWNIIRSPGVANGVWAKRMGSLRNLLTSAQLGSAILTALLTDPFLAGMARRLAGMPAKFLISDMLDTFRGLSRQEAVAAGLMLDDALHVAGQEARYAGALAGGKGTRWLADRTITLSGLAGWTQARKHVFGLDLQRAWAQDVADGKGWEALDPYRRRAMEGFGIGPTEWATMARAPLHEASNGVKLLRPNEIAGIDLGVAERYAEMMHGLLEFAVPTGTKRSRALVTGGQVPGTIPGEVLNGIMQYKSFALSVMMNQIEALGREVQMGGRAGGARYAGAALVTLTLGGAAAIQLRHLANGKDPQPMDDARFWAAAAKTGGGLGIFGDFLFAAHGRFGHSLIEDLAGPVFGFAADVAAVPLGAIRQWGEGDDITPQEQLVKLGRRYTPVVSSLAYTRAAWQRVVMDQLQYAADPDAYHSFRRQVRKLDREYDQGFWWQPGQSAPARAPAFEPKLLGLN